MTAANPLKPRPGLSIRSRMNRILMFTSATAVLLACVGFGVSNLLDMRGRLREELGTLAEVISSNSAAALTFGDREGAVEVLSALRARPSIVSACLYTDTGKPFAVYGSGAAVTIPKVLQSDGFHYENGITGLFYPIDLRGKRIGTLFIASDSRDRNAQLRAYGMIAAGIAIVSLLMAFFLSLRLRRGISEPIIELARVAGVVSHYKDYSMRAHYDHGVSIEIAELMSGFNSMLAEIEQRDSRLYDAKTTAETVSAHHARLAHESAMILNSALDGIMGVDLDNRPTFLNPAAQRMLGVTLDDFAGKSVHEVVHHSHPDGTPWPEEECNNTRALRVGNLAGANEDTFWRPDGTSFAVDYASTSSYDAEGNHVGAVLTFRDATERRAVDRLKNEFVSTVSHELRTPLTSIRGALGLLSSGMLGTMAEKGQRMLEIAVTNTDRLVRLINDMLDLERIGSGKVEFARGPVEVYDVMKQSVDGLLAMADEAGVSIVIERVLGTIWADSDRIIQTLTNLLGNAIKFSPRDTIVTLSGSVHAGEFFFSVADEGRGIPAENLLTIFHRFNQVDASDSRDNGGSGLGLAICESIVTAHGGRIWVEPNQPKGSRFQFTIPLAQVETTPSPAVSSGGGTAPQPRFEERLAVANSVPSGLDPTADTFPCVLVVEDDLDLARVLREAFDRNGICSLHAASGREAIRMSNAQPLRLIVLDIGLRDIDGYAVLAAFRSNPELAHLPLIVYSALEIAASDRARASLGPTEFITKSRCTPKDFERVVARLLETSAEETGVRRHAS